ncbi:hypothetical protein BKA83DRAFT_4504665 [Pisolithus microcarpus]|nr:hypothetical protein BKA83DRAFT_4504665 [Pisolithus microcarpus]
MKFLNTSKELDAAETKILDIYDQRIVKSGSLKSVEKYQHWREAVKEMRTVLESVRQTANRTDNVPLMLIGVDRFVHWTDKLGAPGVPFPDWNRSLFPSRDAIADHPWLLKVEQRYDATRLGWMVRQESSTSEPELVQIPTTTLEPTTRPTSNVELTHEFSIHKGKAKEAPRESEGIEKEGTSQHQWNDDGESEVVEKDIAMDEETSEPVRGRPPKRARSRSESRPASTRRKSQSRPKRSGTKDGETQVEGTSSTSNLPPTPKPKYGRAQVAARTTPPPDPLACANCISRKMVCTWTPGNVPCDPCKKRKIGCGKANVRRASTARTPKPPARHQATPSQRKSSRPRKPAPPPHDDGDTPAPPPRKKARVSQGGQTPQSGAEASSSSAAQRRITLIVRPPEQSTSTHAVPPAIRPESSSYTPLPAPPPHPSIAFMPPPDAPSPPRMPQVDPADLSIHRRLDDIICRQDLILGRVDQTDLQVARLQRRTQEISEARMQVLEQELADCRLMVGTLMREMETLRVSIRGAQPVQTTGPPTADEDLLNLFGPSPSDAATHQGADSITAELHGLVVTTTQSSRDIEINQQVRQGSADTAVESGSIPVGSESVAASTGNDEQGGTLGCADSH